MSYDMVREAWGTSPWQVEDESQVADFSGSGSRFRRQKVAPSIYTQDWTGYFFGHVHSDENNGDTAAVNTALNIDLILLKIFSYTDFQTLKNCRLIQKSWRNCADSEIRRRKCSRTFVTTENVLQLLGDLQKPGDLVTSVPSSELVLEKIESDDSSSYWPNLYELFIALGPQESEHISQVKSLTFIWPSSPNDDGPSKNVIHYFLQILQLVSSSLQELNVTHYLMAYRCDSEGVDLQPDLTFDLPTLKSIKILPRAPSDIHYDQKPLTLSSRSLGLRIIQFCPNLENVDNLHLDDPLHWPNYFHFVKNYVNYQRDTADDLDTFFEAELALESLSDSFYLFPYALENQKKRPEDNDDDEHPQDMIDQWQRVLWTSRNTLKKLQLDGNLPFNFPSPNFPILQNLQELQVKIGHNQNLDHLFNLIEYDHCEENPLPNLKKVILILESGWENGMAVNFYTTTAYRSVTSLELCPEFLNMDNLITLRREVFPILERRLVGLNKFFPNIERVTLKNFVDLDYFLPLFLGPRSKFKLRSISFNVHLRVFWKYRNLSLLLRQWMATSESLCGLRALRKMDVFFEDYPPFTAWFPDLPIFTPGTFQLFLNRLPDLRVTFHYNQNQKHIPHELLGMLQRLAAGSSQVGFQHLSRDPWTRSVEDLLRSKVKRSFDERLKKVLILLVSCLCIGFIAVCIVEKFKR